MDGRTIDELMRSVKFQSMGPTVEDQRMKEFLDGLTDAKDSISSLSEGLTPVMRQLTGMSESIFNISRGADDFKESLKEIREISSFVEVIHKKTGASLSKSVEAAQKAVALIKKQQQLSRALSKTEEAKFNRVERHFKKINKDIQVYEKVNNRITKARTSPIMQAAMAGKAGADGSWKNLANIRRAMDAHTLGAMSKSDRNKAIAVGIMGGVGSTAAGAGMHVANWAQTTMGGGVRGVMQGGANIVQSGVGKLFGEKYRAGAGTIMGLIIDSIMVTIEENIKQAGLETMMAGQAKGAVARGVTSSSALSMDQFEQIYSGMAREGGVGATTKSVERYAYEVARYGDAGGKAILEMSKAMGDVNMGAKEANKMFNVIRDNAQGMNLNVGNLGVHLANAARQARLMGQDFKASAGILNTMIKSAGRLSLVGVDVDAKGGEILKELTGLSRGMSTELQAYYGTKFMGKGSVGEAVSHMEFGEMSKKMKVGRGGLLDFGVGDITATNATDMINKMGSGQIMGTIRAVQEQMREFTKSATGANEGERAGNAWIMLKKAKEAGMFGQISDESLRLMATTDVKLIEGNKELYNKISSGVGDPIRAVENSLNKMKSTMTRMEKIQQGMAQTILGFVAYMLLLPTHIKSALPEWFVDWGKGEKESYNALNKVLKGAMSSGLAQVANQVTGPISGAIKPIRAAAKFNQIDWSPGERKRTAAEKVSMILNPGGELGRRAGEAVTRKLFKKRHTGGNVSSNFWVGKEGETFYAGNYALKHNEFAVVGNAAKGFVSPDQKTSNQSVAGNTINISITGRSKDETLQQVVEALRKYT